MSSLKSFLPQIFWSRLCLKLNSTFLASSLTKENYFFKNLESKWVPRLGQMDDEKFLVCHMIFRFWIFQWSIRHSSHYPLDISSLLIFPSDDGGKIRFGNFVWKNQRTQSRNSCLPWLSSDTIFHDSTFSWFYRNFSILLWRWFRR